jgi:protein-tyrosine phosphatase
MVHTRRYLFADIHNFRDLGGYATNNGSMTAYNTFFRSDSPHLMGLDDQAKIRALGIGTIVDLRFPAEQIAMRSPFVDDRQIDYHSIAVMTDFSVYNTRLSEGVPKLYFDVVQHDPAKFVQIFQVLIHATAPTWLYCRVGNVRTGIVTALLLDCVGVPHNEIVADYMRTALYVESIMHTMRQEVFENASLGNASKELFDVALWPRPENIQMLLYFFRLRYGGSAGYLLDAGITSDELKQLQVKFTVASDAK